MNLYIIFKDGKPFNGSSMKRDTFTKAYFDKSVAEKIMKQFCTADANTYYNYGEGYYQNEDKTSYERKLMAKELAEQEMKRWTVKEINLEE